MTTEIITHQEIEQTALSLPEKARRLTVTTQAEYQAAGDFLLHLKAVRERINAVFDVPIAAAHASHKAALAAKAKVAGPVAEADAVVRLTVSNYLQAEERTRKQAEAVALAASMKVEEEARLAQATALEQAGMPDAAEAVLSAPMVVPPMVMEAPKAEGISSREYWTYEITNAALLPREYLIPNEVAIGAAVRSLKHLTNIPGVRAFAKTGIATRRR